MAATTTSMAATTTSMAATTTRSMMVKNRTHEMSERKKGTGAGGIWNRHDGRRYNASAQLRSARMHGMRMAMWQYYRCGKHAKSRCVLQCHGTSNRSGPSQAQLREEVTAPFRTFRLFIFGALGASAGIGSAITLIRTIASALNAPNAAPLLENVEVRYISV